MLLSRIYVSLLITNAYVAAFEFSVGTSTYATKTTKLKHRDKHQLLSQEEDVEF